MNGCMLGGDSSDSSDDREGGFMHKPKGLTADELRRQRHEQLERANQQNEFLNQQMEQNKPFSKEVEETLRPLNLLSQMQQDEMNLILKHISESTAKYLMK